MEGTGCNGREFVQWKRLGAVEGSGCSEGSGYSGREWVQWKGVVALYRSWRSERELVQRNGVGEVKGSGCSGWVWVLWDGCSGNDGDQWECE